MNVIDATVEAAQEEKRTLLSKSTPITMALAGMLCLGAYYSGIKVSEIKADTAALKRENEAQNARLDKQQQNIEKITDIARDTAKILDRVVIQTDMLRDEIKNKQ